MMQMEKICAKSKDDPKIIIWYVALMFWSNHLPSTLWSVVHGCTCIIVAGANLSEGCEEGPLYCLENFLSLQMM